MRAMADGNFGMVQQRQVSIEEARRLAISAWECAKKDAQEPLCSDPAQRKKLIDIATACFSPQFTLVSDVLLRRCLSEEAEMAKAIASINYDHDLTDGEAETVVRQIVAHILRRRDVRLG